MQIKAARPEVEEDVFIVLASAASAFKAVAC
jgi:hypothetical protein